MSADGYMHPANPKSAPANVEAEQALIGCVLFDNGAMEKIGDGLRSEHFHEPFHGRLFGAIEAQTRRGQLADPILIAQQFKGDATFEELGGIRYLADLVDRAPPSVWAGNYARQILDLAQRRDLIRISGEIARDAAQDQETPAAEQIEAAEQRLFSIAEADAAHRGPVAFEESLKGAVALVRSAYERDGHLAGLATGLTDLDRKLGGLHASDLIVAAARPSMGKSALATTIAFNVAKHYAWEPQPDGSRKTIRGGIVLFFSLEMSHEQLSLRLLAGVSGVPSDRMRRGDINPVEYGRIRDAAIEISRAPLYIDDKGAISLAQIATRARRLKRTVGLDLVIVDYLQLVTTDRRHGDNRTNEVGEISQGLKALAKELRVPVLALAQLSRKVEDRDDKRPQLSDLRESGSIEQDADVVMSIYREAYYKAREEPTPGTSKHQAWTTEMAAIATLAELIIGKQRHGPIGTVRTTYEEDFTRFTNRGRDADYGQGRMQYEPI